MSTDHLKLIVTAAIDEHMSKIIKIKRKDNPEEDLYTVKVLHLIKNTILQQLPTVSTLNANLTKINNHIFEVNYVSNHGLVIECLIDQANNTHVQIDKI